jgi:hypothetical protein
MPRKQAVITTIITNTEPERKGFPWSSNELNRLHSEYEMKEMSVYEIASLHKRGVHAILHKLAEESLISSDWKDARGWDFKAPTEKKALPAKRMQKAKRVQKPLLVDEVHDYTGSCSDSESEAEDEDDDSDEEYTLEDAKKDYYAFSLSDKVEFFKNLVPSSLYR